MSSMLKNFSYKIYSATGQFISTWNDVVNDPSFETVINGGFVELVVKLARNTQNFGEGVDVAFGNELRLHCFDNDMPNGVRIFCGYISRYEPINDGFEDSIEVHFLGYHQILQNMLYENSRGETTINVNNIDPALMAKSILDNAIALSGSPVGYDLNTTLQLTGILATYQFNQNSASEALDAILSLCPAGWYWYVDSHKKFNLHPKSSVVNHTFTLGKEIFYLDADKRIENVVNRIYFTGGNKGGGVIQQPVFNGVGLSDATILNQSALYTLKVPTIITVTITAAQINLVGLGSGPSIGDIMTGGQSGATGVILSISSGPPYTTFTLGNVHGTYQVGETVSGNHGGGTVCVLAGQNGTPDQFSWSDDKGNSGNNIVINNAAQPLSFNTTISFASQVLHGYGDTWTITIEYAPDPSQPVLYSRYERQASIQQYGVRMLRETNSNIFDQRAMDLVANGLLDNLQDPEIRCVIRVSDNNLDSVNGYDIESIIIGDTCQIRNYQDSSASSDWDLMTWDVDFWDFNISNLTETVMQIVDIKYESTFVELTISSKIPNISKDIENIGTKLIGTIVADNSASPSIGTTL